MCIVHAKKIMRIKQSKHVNYPILSGNLHNWVFQTEGLFFIFRQVDEIINAGKHHAEDEAQHELPLLKRQEKMIG